MKSLSLASLWCSCRRLHPEAKDHSPLKTLNTFMSTNMTVSLPYPRTMKRSTILKKRPLLSLFLTLNNKPPLTLQIFLLRALAWGSVALWLERVTTYLRFKLEAALSSFKVNLVNLYTNQITHLLANESRRSISGRKLHPHTEDTGSYQWDDDTSPVPATRKPDWQRIICGRRHFILMAAFWESVTCAAVLSPSHMRNFP